MDAFRLESDAYRYLLGKVLLLQGISLLGISGIGLEQLQYNHCNKPYFPESLQFNISHSGNYVVCAMSTRHCVGIDIEEIKPVDFAGILHCFTAREWTYIKNAAHPLSAFYQLWTRKEAVIKADGRGLQINLISFEATHNQVVVDNSRWYVREIAVADGYIAHLATDCDIKDQYIFRQML